MAQGRLMPNEQKRLLGNPGRRPIPDPVVLLDAARAVPDPSVELASEGAAVWQRLWTYAGAWLSPTTDLGLVERYCLAHDDVASLRAQVASEGYLTKSTKGTYIKHPAYALQLERERDLLAMERLLGLNPLDRTRLGLAEVRKQTGMEALKEVRGMDATIIDTTEVCESLTG